MDTSTCTRPAATTAEAPAVAADAVPSMTAAELSDDQLEERLCVLAAQLARVESEFLLLVAELDSRVLWGRAGLRSAAHWLSWRLGLRLGSARNGSASATP